MHRSPPRLTTVPSGSASKLAPPGTNSLRDEGVTIVPTCLRVVKQHVSRAADRCLRAAKWTAATAMLMASRCD